MADTLKALEAERDRLHGKDFSGLIVLVDSSKLVLKIKDSRSREVCPNFRDRNQAWLKHKLIPGTWRAYSIAESRETFV
jgi:hypothetical protein